MGARAPLVIHRPTRRVNGTCFEVPDSRSIDIRGSDFILGEAPRDPNASGVRLGRQFLELNQRRLHEIGVSGHLSYSGNDAVVTLVASSTIGAVPLTSPTSGQLDYGLLVRPRFDWSGLGGMLSLMGWKVTPELLAMASLPTSDRKVPAWVLSSVVLFRLEAMLGRLNQRFELRAEDRSTIRGRVDWTSYASRRVPSAQFLFRAVRVPRSCGRRGT